MDVDERMARLEKSIDLLNACCVRLVAFSIVAVRQMPSQARPAAIKELSEAIDFSKQVQNLQPEDRLNGER